ASDTTSGLASFTCTLDGTSLGSCNSIAVNGDGAHTLVLTARDHAGNNRTITQNASLDTQNPLINASLNGTLGSNNWYTNATLNAAASDPAPGSGLSTFEYNLDNSSWISFPVSGVLTLPEGKHSIDVLARDNAGRTVSSSKSFWLDSVSPQVTVDPTGRLGSNNWYTTNLNLSASTSDATSGIDVFEYSLDSGAWLTYSTPLTITDGSHNVSFWSQDAAGLVTQVDGTYKVDTKIPQIAGNLSGTPGTNGWYISDVTLTASASDPASGSGLEAFNYILNSGTETPYTNALVLSDGEHSVEFNALDKAGLTYSLEQSLKVDTTNPSLSIHTAFPNWIKETVTVNGTASDSGSGLSKVEISTNSGQSWQAMTGITSWSYVWDTSDTPGGIYEVHIRATDNAGLTTRHAINAGVDNYGPKISVPDSWFQWDAVTLDVWDNHSGLSEVRVEISDPEGRWPTRKINLDPENFPLEFKWDRRFGDETVAPLGTYGVKVIAFDKLGNLTRQNASINILLGILPAGPAATTQPYVRDESTPMPVYASTPIVSSILTQAPVMSAFGSTPEPNLPVEVIPETIPTPRSTPTQTNVLDWLQSVFVPYAGEETVTEIGLAEETQTSREAVASRSNVLWGASAAAMIGAVTAYALEERRKQQEEKAKKAAMEAEEEERREKRQAQKMEKLEAKWAQEQAWEEAQLEAEGREQYLNSERNSSLPVLQPEKSSLEPEEKAWLEKKVQAEKPPKPKDGLQTGLAAYYNAMREGEKETSNSQTNWWESTKSFVSEKIIQPFNSNVYQPYLKPGIEKSQEAMAIGASWLDKNLYQPLIKPAIEKQKQDLANDFEWINENIYQPHLKPAFENTKQFVISESKWINEKIVQPYVSPILEKVTEKVSNGISWANEKIYQPYLKPVIEKVQEESAKYVSWVNESVYEPYIHPVVTEIKEKVYEPIVEPIVNDINKYIVQPYVKPAVDEASEWWNETWDQYGEWVHGALDAVGFIPGLGEIADGLNGLIYLGEGRYLDASLTFMSMVPIVGDLNKVAKWSLKAGQEIVETAAEKVTQIVAETFITKVTKESLDEVLEVAIQEAAEELAEKTVREASEELIETTSQTVAEKTLKESTEQFANHVAKESVEEIAEKTVKETSEEVVEAVSQTVTEQSAKEILDEALANTVEDAIVEEAVEETLEQINEKAV
ncbi:MAG TPA: Ig-like domain-containing protein, partial [Anaerolineales bacterium]|nr:Ig-like domain-containing protein [Anaerolineales bacterium]